MVHYEGLFFSEEEIEKMYELETHHLPFKHDEIHCTFAYKPTNELLFDDIVGKCIDIYLTGYGYDDDNSGFEVEIPKQYMKYYKNYDRNHNLVLPHITVSVSGNAVPKKTRKLVFTKFDKKIKIKARFGYWMRDNNYEYLTFEKQKKTI